MISPVIPTSDPATPSRPSSPAPRARPRPARRGCRRSRLADHRPGRALRAAHRQRPGTSSAAWAAAAPDLILHNVQRERLDLTIVERGTLESAYNNDITCRVKSGQQRRRLRHHHQVGHRRRLAGQGRRPAGRVRQVGAGRPAASTRRSRWRTPRPRPQTADANYKIVVSQNKSDLQTAQVSLELARIDLEKYREGDYPFKSLKDVQSRKELAESDLEMWRDRSAWSERMVQEGLPEPEPGAGRPVAAASCRAGPARSRTKSCASWT